MDIVLIILAALFILLGIIGSIVPALPGPPLAYIGMLLMQFSSKVSFSIWFLVGWGIVVLIVLLLDNFLPLWTTKKFGGSKWGVTGSVVGLLVGFFFTPIGIILGTFLGAIIGELLYSRKFHLAFKAGLGAFAGFMLTIGVKLMLCFIFLYFYIEQLILMC